MGCMRSPRAGVDTKQLHRGSRIDGEKGEEVLKSPLLCNRCILRLSRCMFSAFLALFLTPLSAFLWLSLQDKWGFHLGGFYKPGTLAHSVFGSAYVAKALFVAFPRNMRVHLPAFGDDESERCVCVVLPRHQMSTIDRTLQNKEREKALCENKFYRWLYHESILLNSALPQLRTKQKRGTGFGLKRYSDLSCSLFRVGFYQPVVRLIKIKSLVAVVKILSLGYFKLKAQLRGRFMRVNDV